LHHTTTNFIDLLACYPTFDNSYPILRTDNRLVSKEKSACPMLACSSICNAYYCLQVCLLIKHICANWVHVKVFFLFPSLR